MMPTILPEPARFTTREYKRFLKKCSLGTKEVLEESTVDNNKGEQIMKSIIKVVALTLTVSFLSVLTLSAQDHSHMNKGDKKSEKNQMMDAKKLDKNNDGFLYECPMNCQAPSDEPGTCAKCGMELKKVAVGDVNTRMMDHSKMMNHGKMMDHDKMGNMKGMKMDHSNTETHVVHKGAIDVSKIDKNKDGQVFQDMMDWNVISDKAGECPICGMTLKEVTVEQAEKNLKEHGFKTK